MKAIISGIKAMTDYSGTVEILLTVPASPFQYQKQVCEIQNLLANDKKISAEIKQYRPRRSLDANSYMWVLCQKIGEAVGSTKEDVYKKNIREVGQFEILPIRDDALKKWIEIWQSRGLGWVCEVLDDSKLTGYKKVINYYGSSTYDTKEMSILIDSIVQECKTLGIETLTEIELAAMKEGWENGQHTTV